ncbi:MAG: LLM class F420-dependent oxidoreductase, partial [Solirubrobacteraceae bacterium]
ANVPIRMGYEDAVRRIQDLYLEGRKEDAAAAVPFELVDKLALIGPADKLRDRVQAWRDSRVNTLLIGGGVEQVRQAAELVLS